MFVWQSSVYCSSVHSSVLAWSSYLTNVTNESFSNFVKTLPWGVRPFGTGKEFMWTKIPSPDWETDSEALVCFFTSKCCCRLWKVAGQAFSSRPNSGPFPPFATEIHMVFTFPQNHHQRLFWHYCLTLPFFYMIIYNKYACTRTSQISLFKIFNDYANIPEALYSICSMESIIGEDFKTHMRNLWASKRTVYFYFHPWRCLDVSHFLIYCSTK